MYDLANYAVKRRPEPVPFWFPQYRPGFIDRENADLLLPFNETYINNFGNRNPATALTSVAANADIGIPSGRFVNLTPFDGGLKTMLKRVVGTGSTFPLSAGSVLLKYTVSAAYDGLRVGFMELDPLPIHKGQVATVNLYLTPFTTTSTNTIRLYGTTGNTPTTNADLDALTLTTAYVNFSWVTGTAVRAVDISTIVQELIDNDSSYAFGKPIKLVAVNPPYATYSSGNVEIRNAEVHYTASTVDKPRAYVPVTPVGRTYNFGGYSPGEVPLAADIGDTIDGSNIFSNNTSYNGNYVGAAFDGSNYIQYTPSSFTTSWYFRNVINPNYLPDFVELVLDIDLDAGIDTVAWSTLLVEDDVGTTIASIGSLQKTNELVPDRAMFSFKLPLNKAALDVTKLSYLKVKLSNFHMTNTSGGDIKLYGAWLRPVFGQRCALNVTKLTSFTADFAIAFNYYRPVTSAGCQRLLQMSDFTQQYALPFIGDDLLVYPRSTPTYDATYLADVPYGLNSMVIQYRQGTLELYVNGKLGFSDSSPSTPSDDAIVLGPNNWAFSDFRFYKQSLSQPEIEALTNKMFLYRDQSYTDPSTWTSPRDSIGCDPFILFLGLV